VVLSRLTGVRICDLPGVRRRCTRIHRNRLGGVVPCAIALTAEFAPWNRRQLYNGVMLSGSSLGVIVASFVALWLLPDYGWRSLFVVAFAFIVLVPMMYSLLPESVHALISRGRLDVAHGGRSLPVLTSRPVDANTPPTKHAGPVVGTR
jgi:MFS family permease